MMLRARTRARVHVWAQPAHCARARFWVLLSFESVFRTYSGKSRRVTTQDSTKDYTLAAKGLTRSEST